MYFTSGEVLCNRIRILAGTMPSGMKTLRSVRGPSSPLAGGSHMLGAGPEPRYTRSARVPKSSLRYTKETQGSPARTSASSMNGVLKRTTWSDFLSRRRFHTRCLERGSDPAVGSSNSKTCMAGKTLKSLSLFVGASFKKQYTVSQEIRMHSIHTRCETDS